MKPILETIRKLLALKQAVPISQVASYVKVPRSLVLDVLTTNKRLLSLDKRGRITGVSPRSNLRQQLWQSGSFWRVYPGNYGTTQEIRFQANKKLFDRLKETAIYGGYGDSYAVVVVFMNDENEAALRAAGLVPEDEIVLDDRLWEEEIDG